MGNFSGFLNGITEPALLDKNAFILKLTLFSYTELHFLVIDFPRPNILENTSRI
jgi:hypothetical protein